MSWAAFLSELYELASRGIEPGLERMQQALARIGDPQEAMRAVHVAGTNGKGSTARMIAEGIVGQRVGLFTSPHLHSLTERFVIDGAPLEREVLIAAWTELKPQIEGIPLTFFETVTVLAFWLFRAHGVTIAVLETGLGGRLDSTNVVRRPVVTAITRVALDHQSWLGDSIEEIAHEKAGILRPGVPCVVGPQAPEVDRVIDEVASSLGALVIRPRLERTAGAFFVHVGDDRSPPLSMYLPGDHQLENACVAIGALHVIAEAAQSVVDPARAVSARWPGRAELVGGHPAVLFDVGHNPSAARALAAHVATLHFEPQRRALVFGAMKDKDHHGMLTALRTSVTSVFLTRPKLGRAEDPERMRQPGDVVVPDVVEALRRARETCPPEGLVIVTGSTFVVAEARAELLSLASDPLVAF